MLYIYFIGKTTFLKALACQLTPSAGKIEGEILYNGDPTDCGKYLVGKIASYVDERDQHAPTLTVEETMEFAWRCTTGGHHSYNIAMTDESAAELNRADTNLVKVLLIIPVYYLGFDLHFYCNMMLDAQYDNGTRAKRLFAHYGGRWCYSRHQWGTEAKSHVR